MVVLGVGPERQPRRLPRLHVPEAERLVLQAPPEVHVRLRQLPRDAVPEAG